MAKKKTTVDRHKPRFPVQFPLVYRDQFLKLRDRSRRPMVEDMKIAFEEYLAKFDLWPPNKSK